MQYMLLIYLDELGANPTEAERAQCYADSAAFGQELAARGQYIFAAPLHPTTTATSVRAQEGRRVVTDGPFAETREQLGGFFLVDAANLDEAIEIAKRLPSGKWGTVEIRPVVQVSGLPEPHTVDLAAARST
jgi:hypothetical protein